MSPQTTYSTSRHSVFTIDEIQPGDYALMAHSDNHAAGMAQQSVLQSLIRLHVGDRDVENVTLEWQPEAAAGGAFIVGGGDGKAADLAGCTFSLYPVEFNLHVGSGGWAKSDGKFELDQLLPIRFSPHAQCPGGNPYVK
jgi:hypothetical protein